MCAPVITNYRKFRPETLSKHVVNYSPNRKGKPFIEGEAEIGGSTRKASVGIVGSSLGSMNQVVGIPKLRFKSNFMSNKL